MVIQFTLTYFFIYNLMKVEVSFYIVPFSKIIIRIKKKKESFYMVLNLSFRSQKCVATKATMSTIFNKVNEHAKVQHVKRKASNEARTLCSCSSSYNYNVVTIL